MSRYAKALDDVATTINALPPSTTKSQLLNYIDMLVPGRFIHCEYQILHLTGGLPKKQRNRVRNALDDARLAAHAHYSTAR